MSLNDEVMQQAENTSVVVGLLETAITTGNMSQNFAAQVFETWLQKKFNDNDAESTGRISTDYSSFSKRNQPATPPPSPTTPVSKASEESILRRSFPKTKSKRGLRRKINSLLCGMNQMASDESKEYQNFQDELSRRKSIPLPKVPAFTGSPFPQSVMMSESLPDSSVYCVYAVDQSTPSCSLEADSVYDTTDDQASCYPTTTDSRGCAYSFSSSEMSYGQEPNVNCRITRSQSILRPPPSDMGVVVESQISLSCPSSSTARIDSGIDTLETVDYVGRGCLS